MDLNNPPGIDTQLNRSSIDQSFYSQELLTSSHSHEEDSRLGRAGLWTLPAGVKSVTIHDPAPPYEADLGCHERKLNILTSGLAELIVRLYYGSFQSCLRDFNIGEPHDQATQPRMAWLNSNVPVRILGKQLTNDVLKSGPSAH
ncbi:hypothetical protein MJO28_013430 [Puccinia striiformis f. sp. tritici]|uniref:Uncharacterized protein n=1 Tax=Puccinia striiformis f. sp. tritici TaxID=168172 RepID=A0ACC0DYS2_9BASI|nr:hypothetical protein MJO28_013430 [Puccinia striiformis f. sp. tritici]